MFALREAHAELMELLSAHDLEHSVRCCIAALHNLTQLFMHLSLPVETRDASLDVAFAVTNMLKTSTCWVISLAHAGCW